MQKVDFQIRTASGLVIVSGYVFTVGPMKFGVSDADANGKKRGRGWWKVTELSTGMSLTASGYASRDNAIADLPSLIKGTAKFMELVQNAVKKYGELNAEINPREEILYPITAWN